MKSAEINSIGTRPPDLLGAIAALVLLVAVLLLTLSCSKKAAPATPLPLPPVAKFAAVDCVQLRENRKAFCALNFGTTGVYYTDCVACADAAVAECNGTNPGDFCTCATAVYLSECGTLPTNDQRIACKGLAWLFTQNCKSLTDQPPPP